MAETVTIATPDHIDLEFDLAGLRSRFAAHVIDLLCLFGLSLLLVLVTLLCLDGTILRPLATVDADAWAKSWGLAVVGGMVFLLQWGLLCLLRKADTWADAGKEMPRAPGVTWQRSTDYPT